MNRLSSLVKISTKSIWSFGFYGSKLAKKIYLCSVVHVGFELGNSVDESLFFLHYRIQMIVGYLLDLLQHGFKYIVYSGLRF
jgi:hypothetical protein